VILLAVDAQLYQAFWTITVAGIAAVSCALLGCFLLLKRMSLLGDAISHGILPGIALTVLLTGRITSVYLLVGAIVFGLLTAFLAQTLTSVGKVSEDASLGIVFTSLFALGVIVISRYLRHVDVDPSCVFYGLLEGVPTLTFTWAGMEIPEALPAMSLALVLTVALILLLWKELKLAAFDPALSRAMGFAPTLIDYLLIALVAGATVTAFEALGSVLVLAMLVAPPATAHLLTDRLAPMLLWSAALAVSCAVLGYVFATVGPYSCNVAGMMAVVSGVEFGLAALLAPRQGAVVRVWRYCQLALRIASEEILASLYRAEEAGTTAYPAIKEHRLSPTLVWFADWNLRRLGLITHTPLDLPALTAKGRRLAQSLVRSHRLFEAYAGKVLQLPPDHVHAPAARLEHYIGPALQQELAEALEEPHLDPHGRAIPPSPAGDAEQERPAP
jgi:manganese/zinc/iron transport system permease protein